MIGDIGWHVVEISLTILWWREGLFACRWGNEVWSSCALRLVIRTASFRAFLMMTHFWHRHVSWSGIAAANFIVTGSYGWFWLRSYIDQVGLISSSLLVEDHSGIWYCVRPVFAIGDVFNREGWSDYLLCILSNDVMKWFGCIPLLFRNYRYFSSR